MTRTKAMGSEFTISHDDGEDVVEVVGYSSGQAANSSHPLRLPKLILQTPGLGHILSYREHAWIPVDVDEMCAFLKKRREAGKQWGMVIVSEGAKLIGGSKVVTQTAKIDAFGHEQLGGVGQMVAQLIEEKTGIETRDVVLGHIQRGGSPTAFDRILGTRLGLGAGRGSHIDDAIDQGPAKQEHILLGGPIGVDPDQVSRPGRLGGGLLGAVTVAAGGSRLREEPACVSGVGEQEHISGDVIKLGCQQRVGDPAAHLVAGGPQPVRFAGKEALWRVVAPDNFG